jgi:inosine-uridine nucleoside N-ribohydrolase
MISRRFLIAPAAMLLLATILPGASPRRKVIINEDAAGPGGSNIQTILLLIQSPEVEVLGITVVSGDQWRDEEIAHTLRVLEIIGRTDIPVMSGAALPLVRTREEASLWQDRYGKASYAGAWDARWYHEAAVIPPMAEGLPTTKISKEPAVSFILRMVHQYPHEVTIYEGGPMTNTAIALSLDPELPALAKELVFMGGSLNPHTDNPEFVMNPRHEFNFWFDPEAAAIVLRAPWKRIICTPTDISLQTLFSAESVKRIGTSKTALAQYVTKFYQTGGGNDVMWDELAAAAWIDPKIITKTETLFMSVDIDHGAGYGNTLTWVTSEPPKVKTQPVEIQVDVDKEKFYQMFETLMKAPIQQSH